MQSHVIVYCRPSVLRHVVLSVLAELIRLVSSVCGVCVRGERERESVCVVCVCAVASVCVCVCMV